MAWALAALLQAQAAIMSFAPPLDRELHVVIERNEIEAGERHRYRAERRLRFHAADGGFLAELTLRRVDSGRGDPTGAMFEAGLSRLVGRPIRFHLDRDGRLVSIDDLDMLWGAVCDGIAAAVTQRPGWTAERQREAATRIAGSLRGLPEASRLEMLASQISDLVGIEEAQSPPGAHPVKIPGASPLGGSATMTGTRTVTIAPGLIRITTRTNGRAPASASASAQGGTMEMETVREIDRATGLVVRNTTRGTNRAGASAASTYVTSTTITPVS